MNSKIYVPLLLVPGDKVMLQHRGLQQFPASQHRLGFGSRRQMQQDVRSVDAFQAAADLHNKQIKCFV